MPVTVCFQLVGHALNTLQQLTFQDTIEFYSRKRDCSSNFIVNLYSTLYLKGVFALLYFLQHKDNQRPRFMRVKTNSVNKTYFADVVEGRKCKLSIPYIISGKQLMANLVLQFR